MSAEVETVTVVIPVYNGEESISKALRSAVNQTYPFVEIVVVDDASTDGTAGEVLHWAREDGRVRLVRHEHNRGVLMARKTGVLEAKGAYIACLDADDELKPDACRLLVAAMRETGAEMIHFLAEHRRGGRQIAQDTADILDREAAGEGAWQGAVAGKELLSRFFVDKKLHWTVWSKFVSAGLAKHVYGMLGEERCDVAEDAMLTFLMLANAKRVCYLPDKLYIYHIGIGITGAMNSQKARAVAGEYRVYTLLHACLTDAQLADGNICSALAALHDALLDAVFWHLLNVDDPCFVEEAVRALEGYCGLPDLVREMRAYRSRENERFAREEANPGNVRELKARLEYERGEWKHAEEHYLADIRTLTGQMERDRRLREEQRAREHEEWAANEAHYLADIRMLTGQMERDRRLWEEQRAREHEEWAANEAHYLADIRTLTGQTERDRRLWEEQRAREHEAWAAKEEHYLANIRMLTGQMERDRRLWEEQCAREHEEWAANEAHYLADIGELKTEIARLTARNEELERALKTSVIARVRLKLASGFVQRKNGDT